MINELRKELQLWQQIEKEYREGSIYSNICYKHIRRLEKQIKEKEGKKIC